MNIQQSYTESIGKINYFFALVLAFSLALPTQIIIISWLGWLITWVLEGRFLSLKNFSFNKNKIPFLLFALFFVWQVISLKWTSNLSDGYKSLEKQISFIAILPIVFFGVNKYYKTKLILLSLLIGTILSLFLYYAVLLYVYNADYFYSGGNAEAWKGVFDLPFFQNYLVHLKHRLYLCTIISLSIIYLPVFRKELQFKIGKPLSVISLVLISLLLLAYIYATGSRSNLLALMLIAGIYCFKWAWLNVNKFTVIGISMVFILILGVTCKYHPRLKTISVKNAITTLKTGTVTDSENYEPRMLIWNTIYESKNEFIWYGKGVGSSTNFLVEKYKEKNLFPIFIERRFSAHNQYLSTTMELGIGGAIFLVFLFIAYPFFFKNSTKRLAFYFSFLMGFNMLTEGMLGRIEGILILLFFSLFFLWHQEEENIKQLNS